MTNTAGNTGGNEDATQGMHAHTACGASQGCACGVPQTEQTQQQETTALEPGKKKWFWSDWTGKRKFWTVVGILFLISFLTSGAIGGEKTTITVNNNGSTDPNYTRKGEAVFGSSQNGTQTTQNVSGLSTIYTDVQKKVVKVQEKQESVTKCQVNYPPAKYGDQCLTKLLTSAQDELAVKVGEYNSLSLQLGDSRGSMPAKLDPKTGNSV